MRDGAADLEGNASKPRLKEERCIPPEIDSMFVRHMEDVLDVFTQSYDPDLPLTCLRTAAGEAPGSEIEGSRPRQWDSCRARVGVMAARQGACFLRAKDSTLPVLNPSKSEGNLCTTWAATLTGVRSPRRRFKLERAELSLCHLNGETLDPSYQNSNLEKAVEAGVLSEIRLYDLRHTAATILLSPEVHMKLVCELLGRTTTVLTLDTYSHLIPAQRCDTTAPMDAVFTPAEMR